MLPTHPTPEAAATTADQWVSRLQDLLGAPSYDDLCRAPTVPGGMFPLIPFDNPTSAFVQDLLTKVGQGGGWGGACAGRGGVGGCVGCGWGGR